MTEHTKIKINLENINFGQETNNSKNIAMEIENKMKKEKKSNHSAYTECINEENTNRNLISMKFGGINNESINELEEEYDESKNDNNIDNNEQNYHENTDNLNDDINDNIKEETEEIDDIFSKNNDCNNNDMKSRENNPPYSEEKKSNNDNTEEGNNVIGIQNKKARRWEKKWVLVPNVFDFTKEIWLKQWVIIDKVEEDNINNLLSKENYYENYYESNTYSNRYRELYPKKYQCSFDECGKIFVDASSLKKHMLTHGEKQYICKYEGCGKKFLDNSKLRRHQLVHTGEKPFKCDLCGKKFSLDFNLKTHLRTHTGEKPYFCSYSGCDKRFTQSSNLTAHEKTHKELIEKERKSGGFVPGNTNQQSKLNDTENNSISINNEINENNANFNGKNNTLDGVFPITQTGGSININNMLNAGNDNYISDDDSN